MCERASRGPTKANPSFLFYWVFLGCVKAEADTFSSGCPYACLWGGTIPDQLSFECNSVLWKSRCRQKPRVARPRNWSHWPWGAVLMRADCLYLLLLLYVLLNPQLHESPTRQSRLPKPQPTFVGNKKAKVAEVAAGLDHLLAELNCTRQQWKKVSCGHSYDLAVQRNKLRSSGLSSAGQESGWEPVIGALRKSICLASMPVARVPFIAPFISCFSILLVCICWGTSLQIECYYSKQSRWYVLSFIYCWVAEAGGWVRASAVLL